MKGGPQRFLVLILAWGCAAACAGPASGTRCRRVESSRPWSYCVTVPPNPSGDLLYYLHGGGGSAKNWSASANYPAAVRKAWKAGLIPEPTAVAVSFGPRWLLAERNASPDSGLFEHFVSTLMPAVERDLAGPMARRLLIGESMGGFNAAQLALKAPGLFDRIAMLCPGISDLPPSADSEETGRYAKRTGADPRRVRLGQEIGRQFLPDRAAWEAAAPLSLAKTHFNARSPRLYVSCGQADEFGFFDGARTFAELAQANGVATTWHPLPGGHCVVDVPSLARFLSEP